MPKKILLLRFTPYDSNPNSYNIQEVGIGKAFCRMGFDYDHICFKKRNPQEWTFYEYNGCKARFIEYPRKRFFRMGLNFDLCKKEFLDQYDIVICREYYQIMSYLISKNCDHASLYSGPYWNMFMFKFVSPLYDFLFTKSINRNMHGIFVKSVLAKNFLENKGYTGIENVGVGLDMERFDEAVKIEKCTKEITEYMKSNRCMLFIGNLCDNKNFPLMIETFMKVKEIHPDVKFVMIGKPCQTILGKLLRKKDEDYPKEILAKYPQSLRNDIVHVEMVPNSQLKFIYPLAKAFLLPSKLEIFGMVLLEAMYFGAPVITSKNGGSMTLIGKDGPGIMLESYSANEWAAAVIKLLDNPEMAEMIKKEAHTLVKEQYNWDVIAKKMIDKIITSK